VKAFAPLTSGELQLDVVGEEVVNQPSKLGCPSATAVLREAPVSSRLHKGTFSKIVLSIPNKSKLAIGLCHLFKSTCLIWRN